MNTRSCLSNHPVAISEEASHESCALCTGHNNSMSYVHSWRNSQARDLLERKGITSDKAICRPCRDDIRRVLEHPNYQPRWKKGDRHVICCIDECSKQSFAHSKFASLEQLKRALEASSLSCSSGITIPTPLCNHHYHTIYSVLHQPQQTNCSTCGISLKHANSRSCPDAEKVKTHLQVNAGFNGDLSTGDKVCYSCYKSHLVIVKQVSNDSDSDLQEVLDNLMNKLTSSQQPSTLKQVHSIAIDKTAVYVCNQLLQGQAILLTVVHEYFDECCREIFSRCGLNLDKKVVTSMWVLSHLTNILQHHLVYSCKACKYGTLLYRPNTDFNPLLQHALWKIRQHNLKPVPPDNQQITDRVLSHLNTLVLNQTKCFLSKDPSFWDKYSTTNFDEIIDEINPDLWNAICKLTSSKSEKRQVSDSEIKKIRRCFLLCSMMYSVDNRCSLPLHTLVSDLIDSQGGSARLIKSLNRLGVCTSMDTLSRFIQSKVAVDGTKHPCDVFFKSSAFTVVSVDNIDFLHSCARVAKGHNTSSSHATSVQIVQPMPSLDPINSRECVSPISDHEPDRSFTHPVHISEIPPGNPVMASNLDNASTAAVQDTGRISCRKRSIRPSPTSSPLPQLPTLKVQRRARTGTEFEKQLPQSQKVAPMPTSMDATQFENTLSGKSLADFMTTTTEMEAFQEMKDEMFSYMMQKVAIAKINTITEDTLINLQDYFTCLRSTHTEKSEFAYLEVMNAVADRKETIIELLADLHEKFIKDQDREYLVVEGDQKVYNIIESLKCEYGKDMNWLIPFPGDWHLLKNFQPALLKPYFDAGLKHMAKAAGYPVASIQCCGSFKRTHHFILEAWEALYRCMICKYLNASDEIENDLLTIANIILSQPKPAKDSTLSTAVTKIYSVLANQHVEFTQFVQRMSEVDDTWKFWAQFVFEDAAAYISLFLGIRSGDWNLRLASIKNMAPVFTAFDHTNYLKLISTHLADLLCMPESILTMFQQGAFVVSIGGNHWHSVAVDEAHEMLINKGCKTSMIRPTPDCINRQALYMPFRAKALENFHSQLFPEETVSHSQVTSMLTSKPADTKREVNVVSQMQAINDSNLLEIVASNRGLLNPFTSSKATAQQTCDLLSFRDIGKKEFHNRITFHILKNPSTSATIRKRHLQTFSTTKANKQRVSQLERDRKLILTCMRKKIKWSLRTGVSIKSAGEQLIPFPLAISDHQGKPNKGQKCNMTKSLVNRYKTAPDPILLSSYPHGWTPQCIILEGMIMINTTPLKNTVTFGGYAHFLLTRHVLSHFSRGGNEVHLIFDTPGRLTNTPKYFEQQRRDSTATISPGHTCRGINEHTTIPAKWREDVLNCRTCKRALVCFLADFMLRKVQPYLSPHHKFYVAGAFPEPIIDTAWFVHGNSSVPQPDPSYNNNSEEADTRLWLHVRLTECTRVLIVSTDTDIYFIGLPLHSAQNKDIIIQISSVHSKELQLLQFRNLVTAFRNDPDLANVQPSSVQQVMQTLYVVSGCDYISFFKGIGKATFIRYFFQHAQFITGNSPYTQGSLSDVSLTGNVYTTGFLAFLRLIGTIYFKKYITAFDYNSPETHFKSLNVTTLSSVGTENVHTKWLEDSRQQIWDRTTSEDEMIPSTDALWRHWLRSCWVMDMWGQADHAALQLAPLTSFGWNLVDDVLKIEWDSSDNIAMVKERVGSLTKGCKCRSGCGTSRCGCRKKGWKCSEGCECIHCLNLPSTSTSDSREVELEMDDENDLDEIEELDEMMDNIFGPLQVTEHDSDIDPEGSQFQ